MTIHYVEQGTLRALASVAANVLYFRVPFTGKIKRVDVYCGATSISGDAVFDINVGPSPGAVISIFGDPADRPRIATGTLAGSAAGLNVSVTAGWIGTVDLDSIPAGGIGAPFFVVITLDDELSVSVGAEEIQDVVGAMLTDSSEMDFTYDDAGNVEALVLKTTGVTAGVYGDATHSARLTLDSKGRVTAASEASISGGGGAPTGEAGGDLSETYPNPTVRAIRNRLYKALPSGAAIGDDFNDNLFHSTKWQRSDVNNVVATNSRMEIYGAAGHWFRDVERRNFTNRFLQARMEGVAIMRFFDVPNTSWLEIRRDPGGNNRVKYTFHTPGGGDDSVLVSDTSIQKWFKLTHTASDGQVRFYSAPDVSGAPGTWVLQRTIAPSFSMSDVHIWFLGVGDLDWFDNITSDIPGADTVVTGETYAWNAATTQFENTPLGSVRTITADPSGAPLNLLPGHTPSLFNVTNNKLWIWNSSAWKSITLS